jgi:hypothetical protein
MDAIVRITSGNFRLTGRLVAQIGGPRDGETTTFLASVRGREDLATSLFPGYRLHHDGTDPLAGWQMRHSSDEA